MKEWEEIQKQKLSLKLVKEMLLSLKLQSFY